MSLAAPTVLEPADLAEAHAAVAGTPGALEFRGGGTKATWGAPVERRDLLVSTRRLDALVDHRPRDLVAEVEAGMPLRQLQKLLAPHGQWLAVDPARTEAGATVGGVFATDDAGPRRQRHGTLRDLVLGVTVVLSDGTVARAGGRVVKNVAGYDLMRLLCGSLGTLGLVTSLIVRLHPLPEAGATVRLAADATTAVPLGRALVRAVSGTLTAVRWDGRALHARVEGRLPAVRAAAAQALAAAGAAVPGAAGEVLTGPDQEAAWRRMAEVVGGPPPAAPAGSPATAAPAAPLETTARAVVLPGGLLPVASALHEAAAAEGVEVELVSDVGLGLHTARLRGSDARAHAAAVARWRRAVSAAGGTVVLRDADAGVSRRVDAWLDPTAPPPDVLPLLRRLKAALDPDRRCAPGRALGDAPQPQGAPST